MIILYILAALAWLVVGAILTTTVLKVVAGTAYHFVKGDNLLRYSMLFAFAGIAALVSVIYFSA